MEDEFICEAMVEGFRKDNVRDMKPMERFHWYYEFATGKSGSRHEFGMRQDKYINTILLIETNFIDRGSGADG